MEADSAAAIDRYKPRGVTRVIRALGSSIQGLTGAFRDEAAFRQELALAVSSYLWACGSDTAEWSVPC